MNKNRILSLKDFFGRDHLGSSSEALELIRSLKGVGNVTLDFSGIDSIDETFARELFVAWYKSNPNVMLNVIRANEQVETAIGEVLRIK